MARKNNSKSEHTGSILFDPKTRAVMSGPDNNDNIKEKVQRVREVVPGKSNNEIVLVLQHYENNVERAIQAFLEDGAKEALAQWHVPIAKANKKKNKKKKAAGGSTADSTSTPQAAGGAGAPSLNPLSTLAPLTSAAPLPQRASASITSSLVFDEVPVARSLVSAEVPVASSLVSATAPGTSGSISSKSSSVPNGDIYTGSYKGLEVLNSNLTSTASPDLTVVSPITTNSTTTATDSQAKHLNHRLHTGTHGHSHHSHSARPRTASERSTASSVGAGGDYLNHSRRPFQGLEKSIKDLQRQTTSLERLRQVLDHEIDRSTKSIKTVFDEMRSVLNSREKELMAEMETVKEQANDVLKMRQDKAAFLKVQIERAEKLSETELAELRSDVKHFVADRKIDEELGKTTRFQYDSDHLRKEIQQFGHILPVKCSYTARRQSASSLASSGVGLEDHNPTAGLHPEAGTTSQYIESGESTRVIGEELDICLPQSLTREGVGHYRLPQNARQSGYENDNFHQSKTVVHPHSDRGRQVRQQKNNVEEVKDTAAIETGADSRSATPSSTQASAGSSSPSPQRGGPRSPRRAGIYSTGGTYRGRGRGGQGSAGYRGGGGNQGFGGPRGRPYSGSRGGRGGGYDNQGGRYYRQGEHPVTVNGGVS